MSISRVRRIISDALQKRLVDSGSDPAKLQLGRLAPATGGRSGRRRRRDGHHALSQGARQVRPLPDGRRRESVYDDEARKKLLDEINRIAENLGVDEVVAAAREYLKKIGEIPDDEPGEAEGGADETGPETVTAEANGLDAPDTQAETSPELFIGIVRNPLKSPDSKK